MKARRRSDLRHVVIFALLGAIQFLSKQILEFLPNIELVSTLTMVYTLVYRKRALIPVFVFILMEGLLAGFSLWWIPYLYLWPILWGMTMLLPKKLPVRAQVPVYAGVCALFGLIYGTLYAPFQSIVFLGGDLRKTLIWIANGLRWDVYHALGNLAFGTLIVPLTKLLRELDGKRGFYSE